MLTQDKKHDNMKNIGLFYLTSAKRGRVIMIEKAQSAAAEATVVKASTKPVSVKAKRPVVRRKASLKNENAHDASQQDILGIEHSVTVSDAIGSNSILEAASREGLVLAQNATSLMRRQEALFRQANVLLSRIPEERREGVRQAVLVYARNVRSWQMQAEEQGAAFLAAQSKDKAAKVSFVMARNSLNGQIEEAGKRRFRWFGLRKNVSKENAVQNMEKICEQADLIRDALHDQGLAIHRYMRFQSEWRNSMEEMMSFVSEQMS